MLALVALAAGFPFIFSERVPVSAKNLLSETPWRQAAPQDLAVSLEDGPGIKERAFYPWYVFLNDAAKYGDSFLWNPLEGCGIPFLALWRSRCFSPFSLPFYLWEPPTAFVLSALAKLLVAGLCAYYAARKFAYVPPLALFVGCCFTLSGPVLLWLGRPLSDVTPWLPLWLLFVERLLVGQARYWPYGALIVALMTLGGCPEALITCLLFGLLFMGCRIVLARRRPERLMPASAAFGAALIVGAALAAIQLLPYFEFVGQSVSGSRPEGAPALRPADLAVVFLPHFFGKGAGLADGRAAQLLHVGVVPLLLLPLWFAVRNFVSSFQRHRIEALLITCVVMTAMPLGCGAWLRHLPIAGGLGPQHFLIANGLVLAFCAAAAAEEWLELDADQCRSAILRLIVLFPVLFFVAFIVIWLQQDNAVTALWPQLLVVAGFALGCLAVLVVTLLSPSPFLMGYLLVIASSVGLIWAFFPNVEKTDRDLLFPETEMIKTLKAQRSRIGGGPALSHWPIAGNLIPQTYCSSGVVLKRQKAFWEQAGNEPHLLRRAGASKLLLTEPDLQGVFAAVRPQLKIDRVFKAGAALFDDPENVSRARIAFEIQPVDEFNPELFVPGAPPQVEGAKLPEATAPPAEDAHVKIIDALRYDRVEVGVDTPQRGLLVLADTWYPGWKATLDGRPLPIHPVDSMFRGVMVPKGQHTVVFYYAPRTFKIGMGISIAALAVVLFGICYTLYLRLRERTRPY